jgi:hypothetical protein
MLQFIVIPQFLNLGNIQLYAKSKPLESFFLQQFNLWILTLILDAHLTAVFMQNRMRFEDKQMRMQMELVKVKLNCRTGTE